MTFEYQRQRDVFCLWPAVVIGEVGEVGGKGVGIAWGFWFVSWVTE